MLIFNEGFEEVVEDLYETLGAQLGKSPGKMTLDDLRGAYEVTRFQIAQSGRITSGEELARLEGAFRILSNPLDKALYDSVWADEMVFLNPASWRYRAIEKVIRGVFLDKGTSRHVLEDTLNQVSGQVIANRLRDCLGDFCRTQNLGPDEPLSAEQAELIACATSSIVSEHLQRLIEMHCKYARGKLIPPGTAYAPVNEGLQ